jgi:hypothetical protein
VNVARSFPIENRAALPAAEYRDLVDTVSRHTSIKHGLDWVLDRSPPGRPIDVVAQDEFSHDVLFELSPDLWLAYSCT